MSSEYKSTTEWYRAELEKLEHEKEKLERLLGGVRNDMRAAGKIIAEQEDEVKVYRALLDQLLYYNNGRWYVGFRGDVDVTDLVGKYLKVEEQ